MSTLKDVYDIIKDLRILAKECSNQEMIDKSTEIQESFFEMREAIADLKDENRELKNQIKELNDNSELENDLELVSGCYLIRKSEKEKGLDNKYCPACWQNYKKLMPIVKTIGNRQQCCNCHTLIL